MGTEASRGGADSPRMPRGARGGAWGSLLSNNSLEKKMLNNLHKFFQGKRKSLESFYLLYGIFFYTTFLILKFNNLLGV